MKLTKKRNGPNTIDTLRREMDHFFDDLVPFSWSREQNEKALGTWAPSADITENEKRYEIMMDIPGMDKNDIKVNIQDDRVTITGERKTEEKEENDDFIRQERYYGSFFRSFKLPEKVKDDDIKATFKDGVLKVVIPKAEVIKPKSIKVS
ncbi:Hsp20/alpha crystallin family protein [Rhodohalobacter sp. SW132]|uniref:Hsp20/alpha crystallin family protein n=1 Tax=Rhodohalobacter sp. SW132 TaxID=2293433 RepID=UPI001314BEC7|nr:Hsp20/alpha crystallin family protein [Rhodohalobacter sp. SW132]